MPAITKRALLVLFSIFILTPSAYAYSPPPAGNILLLIQPRQAKITIELPPKLIMTPAKLSFPQAGVVYTFDFQTGQFLLDPPRPGPFPNHRVSVSTKRGAGPREGDYYVINITGFEKDELPKLKDFRLTFDPSVTKSDIESVANYLGRRYRPIDTARLSGPNCNPGGESHICLKTITKVSGSRRNLPEADLFQTIPLKGIIVSGNSAALNGTLDGFIQSGTALAVGKSVGTVVDGRVISGYDNNRISPINWTNIGSKLINQFDSNKSYNKNEVAIYDAANWNLNSSNKLIPSDSGKNTFSTPPEGRLWNVYVDPSNSLNHWGNDFYNIGKNKNVGTLFSGAGTVSVRRTGTEGPMSVTVHGGVPCAPGTRFALITKGNIVFDTPADGELKIDCGAYISLEGNIIFGNNDIKKGTVNGIFIARGSILLPDPGRLTDTFNINPDTNILKNPPVLLRELLKIVFGSSS